MNDFWKLPKAVRNSVGNRIKQLQKNLKDQQNQINRLENQLKGEKWSMEQTQKELDKICRDNGIVSL